MDPITPRNRNRESGPGGRQVTPEVYWRRRLFALAAGLAVFGLLAWAVGGAASHPRAAATSFNQPQQQDSPTGFPTPTMSSVSPMISPSVSSGPSTSSSGSPSPSPSASGGKDHGKHAKKAKKPAKHHQAKTHARTGGINAPGDDCPGHDVVISLTANGDSFGVGGHPEFTVDVVSTAGKTCAFNIGAKYLTAVVESGGVREWGSADCYHGAGSQVAMLHRGVPVRRKFSWDRMLSSPGCHLAPTHARPGTYTATVSDAGVHSRTVVFTLR
ncbi:MAG TPA: hypothetical protein VHY58_05970 [Streptosporangiaceae bacterium]|jgi:hypothetical protein|nr:hypothetical protein [Streptosporangiaceae bacterium]